MVKINTILLILFVVFLGLFLRVTYFVGPCCDDDVAYLNVAHEFMKLNFIDLKNGFIFAYRTMMVVPIAISFKILGISEFTASMYILLSSIGSIIVAFLIGKLLFNNYAAFLAALLMTFYPLEVIYSTHLVPDVPLAFFIGLSVLIFLYANKKNKNSYYILAGIIVGLAYLVKTTAILIFPFILLYSFFFLQKNKMRTILKFLVGFALIYLIEISYSYYFTGNIFTTYKSYVSAQESWGFMNEKSEEEIKAMLSYYPNLMFGINTGISHYCGYFFWLLLIAILFPLSYKKGGREFLIVLLWFFSIFMYLQFGTMDARKFVLMHRLERFITILSIPMSLTIAHFLEVISTRKSLVIGFITINLLIMPLFFDSLTRIEKMTSYENKQVLGDTREIYSVLKTLPEKDIYFYQFTREFGLLQFYFNFKNEHLKLIYNTPCESIKNAYVVVDDNRWYFEGGPEYPKCFKNPPENWKLITTIKKADEGIYGRFDPKIYWVE